MIFIFYQKTLENMSVKEFETYKMSLKDEYEAKLVNQEQRLNRYWHEIELRHYHFDRHKTKVKVLKLLKIMDIVRFF